MTKTTTLLSVAVVCVILIALYINHQNYNEPPLFFKSKILSHAPSVGVVVLRADSILQTAKISTDDNEKDLYLILKERGKFYLFSNLNQLAPYDTNRDNIIDASDPLFEKLYIGRYTEKNHTLSYRPINKTAIRAIKLKKDSQSRVVIQAKAMFLDMLQLSHAFTSSIIQRRMSKDEIERMIVKPVA